jgi:hypothetical protein
MRPFRLPLPPLGALLLAAVLGTALGACQPKQEPTAGDTAPKDTTMRDSVRTISGTVHHVELEGGFWLIRADDGAAYDPMDGLPEAFRQEDLKVVARVRPRTDVMSTHQAGTIVEIVEIRKR